MALWGYLFSICSGLLYFFFSLLSSPKLTYWVCSFHVRR